MRHSSLLLAAALLIPLAAHADVAPADPDWPCMSIRVAQMSLASVWDGPPADPFLASWAADADVAALVRRVTPRRVPLASAQQSIRTFAAGLGPGHRERLLALVAGLFDTLDQERSVVLAGLDRLGRRQKQLNETILGDMARMRTQPQDGAAPLADQLNWEVRLFEQRRQSTSAVCNVPTIIEQRLFALVRTVREAME
jgi:hypothetical protein